jgi:hypothetical protein
VNYTSDWDLATIPRQLLRAEYARAIRPPSPRARKEAPCIGCLKLLSARERRKPCLHCGARQPRKPKETK